MRINNVSLYVCFPSCVARPSVFLPLHAFRHVWTCVLVRLIVFLGMGLCPFVMCILKDRDRSYVLVLPILLLHKMPSAYMTILKYEKHE